jgi:phospholipid transport system substrate-binding protein
VIRGLLIALFSFVVTVAHAAEPKDGQELVESVSNQILQEISENRALYVESSKALHEVVSAIILPHFDFEKMSKLVMVRYWRKMDAEQRSRFEKEFRGLMVRIYSKALLEYEDEEIKYLPTRVNKKRDRIIVRTKIIQSSGGTLAMDYHLQLSGEVWKIFDIRVEGISLLKSYKDRFGREAKVKGVDAVIDELIARNKKAVAQKETIDVDPVNEPS